MYIRSFLIITGLLLMTFFGGQSLYLQYFGTSTTAIVDKATVVKHEQEVRGKAHVITGYYLIESKVSYHFTVNDNAITITGADTNKIFIKDKDFHFSPGSQVKVLYSSVYPKLNGMDQKGTVSRQHSYNRFFLGLVIFLWGVINPKIPDQTVKETSVDS